MRRNVEKQRVSELFIRSKSWLLEIAISKGEYSSIGLGDLLRILLGVWLCECISQCTVPSSTFHDVAGRVEDHLGNEVKMGIFDPFSYDAKLLLLCHHILSIHRYQTYGLESFMQQIAEALRGLQNIPLRYTGEALLLSQLGYCNSPPVPILQAVEAGGDAFRLIRADEDQIRAVCNNISAATHFGQKPLHTDADIRSCLDHILPIILLQTLRRYNLELGTILLRTIHYLHLPKTRAIRLAINFLMSQQRSNGRFGYFSMEVAQLEASQPSFDATSKIYVPVTVSCLWTLAETLTPGFNLFSFPTIREA